MNRDWWLLGRDRVPVGPTTEAELLQRIQTGRVPADALICEVGAAEWVPIQSVSQFAMALAKLRIDGPTMVDPLPELPSTAGLDLEEQTLSNVHLGRFEESSDATVVEKPLLSSEPPRPR